MSISPATTANLFKSLFARMSPQDCALCGSATPTTLCVDCERGLPWSAGSSCPRCAADTDQPIESHEIADSLCGACVTDLPHFDRTITAFRYDFPVDRLIQAYKFRANLALTGMLAAALVRRVQAIAAQSHAAQFCLPDLILPTPLATKRLAERGFNQSALLGREVAKRLGCAFSANGLRRVRETRPQSGLKRDERLKNVRGAFECLENVAGKRIAIVDDVMTTGATLSEAAKALKQNGAIYVEAWAVARAHHH